MRVVANHAGPVKEIEKRFTQPKFNLQATKLLCEFEAETIEIASSIQRNSKYTQLPRAATEKADVESGSCDQEELEEIRGAIADAPFMPNGSEPESSPTVEPPVEDKFSAPVARTILERLRDMNIPLSQEVRTLVAQTPIAQMEHNVSALEEESATKGLKSPIAALKYFVTNNCQPRNDRQSWWNRAAAALGKQRRDHLIQAVFEYAGEVVVMFTNGRRLPLAQAQGMSTGSDRSSRRRAMSDTLFDMTPYKSDAAHSYSPDWIDATGSDPSWDQPDREPNLETRTDEPDGDAPHGWLFKSEFSITLKSGQIIDVKFVPGLEGELRLHQFDLKGPVSPTGFKSHACS